MEMLMVPVGVLAFVLVLMWIDHRNANRAKKHLH